MTPIIKICNFDKNTVVITDLTLDSSEYISENTLDPELYNSNKYKYSETYTINIIEKVSSKSSSFIDTIYTNHSSYLDEAYYSFEQDGLYIIHHIILPSVDWLNELITNLTVPNLTIYVTDGNNIYKFEKDELILIDSSIIAEVNTNNTTISRVDINQFSICKIHDCYVLTCRKIFGSINYKCNTNLDKDLIFKRDFLWMTINVLKYYIELNLLLEALRLLEEINFCGGLCNENRMFTNASSGCGCNK